MKTIFSSATFAFAAFAALLLTTTPRPLRAATSPSPTPPTNAVSDKITLQGARYPEHLQKLVGR